MGEICNHRYLRERQQYVDCGPANHLFRPARRAAIGQKGKPSSAETQSEKIVLLLGRVLNLPTVLFSGQDVLFTRGRSDADALPGVIVSFGNRWEKKNASRRKSRATPAIYLFAV
jgi:hypothetical protein